MPFTPISFLSHRGVSPGKDRREKRAERQAHRPGRMAHICTLVTNNHHRKTLECESRGPVASDWSTPDGGGSSHAARNIQKFDKNTPNEA